MEGNKIEIGRRFVRFFFLEGRLENLFCFRAVFVPCSVCFSTCFFSNEIIHQAVSCIRQTGPEWVGNLIDDRTPAGRIFLIDRELDEEKSRKNTIRYS